MIDINFFRNGIKKEDQNAVLLNKEINTNLTEINKTLYTKTKMKLDVINELKNKICNYFSNLELNILEEKNQIEYFIQSHFCNEFKTSVSGKSILKELDRQKIKLQERISL